MKRKDSPYPNPSAPKPNGGRSTVNTDDNPQHIQGGKKREASSHAHKINDAGGPLTVTVTGRAKTWDHKDKA